MGDQDQKNVRYALCGSDDYDVVCNKADLKRGSKKITNVICERCGLIYNNPMPSDDILTEYYLGGFIKNMTGLTDFEEIKKRKNAKNNKLQDVVKFISPFIDKQSKVFDIGCSKGGLLLEIKNSIECYVKGLEPDKNSCKFATEVNKLKNIDNGFFDDRYIEKNIEKYDLVVLRHVLEHLKDPNKAIENIKSLLNDNGYLYLAFPNAMDFTWSRPLSHCLEFGHLFTYTPRTISQLLLKHDMKIVKWSYDYKLHLQIIATRVSNEVNSVKIDDLYRMNSVRDIKFKLKSQKYKYILFRIKRKIKSLYGQ